MGEFETGLSLGAGAAARDQQIAQQQRVENQNTVGARLLDSINNASNIKPTTKDPNGNEIPNPAYAQAQKDKQDLLTQYVGLNSPQQHASFSDHLHGLIFGHPTAQTQQPALSPNSSPVAAPPATAGATAPPPSSAPAHPFESNNPILAKMHEGISALKNHLSAAANPLPPEVKPDPAMIAQYYRDPAQVAFERQQEQAKALAEAQQKLWGVRGQTAEDVQALRNLGSTEQARFDNAYAQSLGLADASQMTAQQRLDAQAAYTTSRRRPQVITDPRSGISNIVSIGPDGTPIASPMLDSNGQPFGGFKPNTVTVQHGVYHFIGADNQVHEVPVTTETTKIFGPHSTPSAGAAPSVPISANAPQFPASTSAPAPAAPANPGARAPGTAPAGGAVKAKPVSSAAPQIPTSQPSYTPTPEAGGGRVLGPAKLSTQDRGILESDQQVQDSIKSILPILEQLKAKGGLFDKAKMLYEWQRYSNGFPIDDPQLAQVIPAVALMQTQGAAPWTRIGRSKYTFDVIQKHLPTPTDTPALLYTKVKWLNDNVLPSSVEATKNPTPTGKKGPVSKNAPPPPGQTLADRIKAAVNGK